MDSHLNACLEFGRQLRQLRLQRGLSQGELANRSGIAGAYLCLLEKAKKPAPPKATANRIAQMLSLDVEQTHRFLLNVLSAREEWKKWLSERRMTNHREALESSQISSFITSVLQRKDIDLNALIRQNGMLWIPPQQICEYKNRRPKM